MLTMLMAAGLSAQKPEFKRKGIVVAESDSVKLDIGIHSVGRLQYLSQNNVRIWDNSGEWKTPVKTAEGMQTSFANLEFNLSLGDNDIDIFMDILLATQRHPSQTWVNNGYMYIRRIPGNSFLTALNPVLKYVDIKAGNFYIDYGEHLHTMTINADTHRNPLIGNPVVAPFGNEPGIEIIHNAKNYGVMAGTGIGAPEQDFGGGRSWSFHTKAWFSALEQLYFSGSLYTVNHGQVSRGANLFRRERLGSPYGGIWNLNNDNTGNGEGPGQVRPGIGKKLTSWEINGLWTPSSSTKISAYYGQGSSLGPNVVPSGGLTLPKGDEKWDYYTFAAQHYLAPNKFYLAARYSNIHYNKLWTEDNTGSVGRLQAGFGAFVTKNILLKGEYVYQQAKGFKPETISVSNGVDVGNKPSFNGLAMEFALSF